jgi:hypothetical protein
MELACIALAYYFGKRKRKEKELQKQLVSSN